MAVWKARGLDLAAWFHRKIRVSGTLPDGGRNEVEVTMPGIEAFAKQFKVHKKLLVGGQGIPLEEFLTTDADAWF